jgi:hypothetical protein
MGFAAPWLLLGLAALPALWWLLRLLPPPPRRVSLPTLRLIKPGDAQAADATPPWWLLALRLTIAALLILGLAGPIWRPAPVGGIGPLILVIENGWTSASRWPQVQAAARAVIDTRAGERPVLMITTAPPQGGWPQRVGIDQLNAATARARLQALQPQPWPVDRAGLAARLPALPQPADIVWISDGLDAPGSDALAKALGRAELVTVPGAPLAIRKWAPVADGWRVELLRPDGQGDTRQAIVQARDAGGRVLAATEASFAPGVATAQASLPLLAAQRAAVARIEIVGEPSAGAVALIPAGSGRPLVGITTGESLEERQPLRSGLFYVRRALEPHAELVEGTLADVLARQPGMIVLVDTGAIAEPTALRRWLEAGGLLVQFAGPRTAESGAPLAPVALRRASRAFGGTLSWGQPLALRPFPPGSPLFGLVIPPDMRVSQQVLADPSPDLAAKTWASLADGTALITAGRIGQGLSVLVHTTASPDWTSLPLTGLLEPLLRQLVPLAGRTADTLPAPRGAPYSLAEALTGTGDLAAPQGLVAPVPVDQINALVASPRTPPGRWRSDGAELPLNLASPLGPLRPASALTPLPDLPGLRPAQQAQAPTPLGPWLLALAGLLFAADALAALWLRGRMPRLTFAALLAVLIIPQAEAQDGQRVSLGYVGGSESAAGLTVLSRLVSERTAIEMGPLVSVDPARTDLGRVALIYWPVRANAAPLSPAASAAVARYLRSGGLILFDTAGAGASAIDRVAAARRLLGGLGLPRLEPLTPEHVLAKAFYILPTAPGAAAADPVWIEAGTKGANGRVSAVVLGNNGWARAWARDPSVDPRTQELALRFGINLLMYALTGTYKADQVHAAALLERLGRERPK